MNCTLKTTFYFLIFPFHISSWHNFFKSLIHKFKNKNLNVFERTKDTVFALVLNYFLYFLTLKEKRWFYQIPISLSHFYKIYFDFEFFINNVRSSQRFLMIINQYTSFCLMKPKIWSYYSNTIIYFP